MPYPTPSSDPISFAPSHTNTTTVKSISTPDSEDLLLAPTSQPYPQYHDADEDSELELEAPPELTIANLLHHSPPVEQLNLHLFNDTAPFSISDLLGYSVAPGDLPDNTCCGLINLGNTCYANALLNSISKIARVRLWFATHHRRYAEDSSHSSNCLLCALAHDITTLTTKSFNIPFRPRSVIQRRTWNHTRTFDNNRQHDANEAFGVLLDRCNEIDLLDYSSISTDSIDSPLWRNSLLAYTTPFWQIFGALTLQVTRCARCTKTTESYQMQSTFSIAVPQSGTPLIEELFANSLGTENLEDTDRCTNEHCRRVGCRAKTTTLVRPPQVLVLHLKRWHYDRHTQTLDKIYTHVSYETFFPLTRETSYNLRSVLVHRGAAGGGHYIAYVRAQNNHWYLCNDAAAPCSCSTDVALGAQAYMLFYERR